MGDSGCITVDTPNDTRGHWLTVAAVRTIHIWIHVASGDSGYSAGDTHMDTRGQWVTVTVVLRYIYGYTWPVGDSGCSAVINICIHVASG